MVPSLRAALMSAPASSSAFTVCTAPILAAMPAPMRTVACDTRWEQWRGNGGFVHSAGVPSLVRTLGLPPRFKEPRTYAKHRYCVVGGNAQRVRGAPPLCHRRRRLPEPAHSRCAVLCMGHKPAAAIELAAHAQARKKYVQQEKQFPMEPRWHTAMCSVTRFRGIAQPISTRPRQSPSCDWLIS